jgi:hypothetical protein
VRPDGIVGWRSRGAFAPEEVPLDAILARE